MITRTRYNPIYLPPKTLGEGWSRVKKALGITECIKKDYDHNAILFRTKEGGTAYFTRAELRKTKNIVPESADLSHNDFDTFAGTAIRVRRSDTCKNYKVKPNQVMQIMKVKFVSDATNSNGVVAEPIHAVTSFKVIKSEDGKPVVEYFGRRNWSFTKSLKRGIAKIREYLHLPNKHKEDNITHIIKNIDPSQIPTENTEFTMPDGNIVYYLRDTIRNGKRAVDMKMYENGLDVQIL